jgi:hypothetical protein
MFGQSVDRAGCTHVLSGIVKDAVHAHPSGAVAVLSLVQTTLTHKISGMHEDGGRGSGHGYS